MSSPARKSHASPKKGRPSTAVHTVKTTTHAITNQFQEEINALMISGQEKDIEIDRLKTTCYTLNNKVSVTEDLHNEIAVLKRRLAENENQR